MNNYLRKKKKLMPPLLEEDLDQRDRILVFLSFPCRLLRSLEVELFTFLDPLLARQQQLLMFPESLSSCS